MADESGTNASISLPDLKDWDTKRLYDYAAQINDYDDLAELGAAINAARVALFRVTEQINRYERKEKSAKIKYDRAYRREYLASVEKTEAMKKMRAELACEELENEYLSHEQLKIEMNRMSYALRLELQTLQAIGNNLRQQMKME